MKQEPDSLERLEAEMDAEIAAEKAIDELAKALERVSLQMPGHPCDGQPIAHHLRETALQAARQAIFLTAHELKHPPRARLHAHSITRCSPIPNLFWYEPDYDVSG